MKNYLKDSYTPSGVIIDITTNCSAACPFCARNSMDNERKNNYMSMEIFTTTLQECAKLDIKKINLYQTGEAMLHPEFANFVKLAKQMEFEIYLSTNGSHVDKHIETLLLIDDIRFSLDGWDKESFELFRYPLKLEKIKKNLELLFQAKKNSNSLSRIGINTIYSKQENFKGFLELFGDYIDFLEVSPLYPTTYYDKTSKSFQISYDDKLKEHYFDLVSIPESEKWCHFPFSTAVISYDGNMSLCCQDFSNVFDLNNIEDGLFNIFNSKEITKIRKEFVNETFETCSNCYRFLALSEEDKQTIATDVQTALSSDKRFKNINLSLKV